MQIRHLLNFILLLLFLTSWLRADVASARNALLQGDLTAAAAALSGQASSAEVQILHSLLDIAQWFEGDLPPLAALIGADAAAAATFTDLSAESLHRERRTYPIYGKSQPLAYSESSGITTYEFVDQDSILALYNSSNFVKTVAIDVTFAGDDIGNQGSTRIEIYANGEWSGYVDMRGQSFSYNYNDWYDGTYQKSFTITIQPGEHVRFQGTSTYYDATLVTDEATSLSFSTADVEIQNGDYWRYDWVQSFEDELFDFELIQEAPGSLWGKDGSLVTDGPVGPGYSVGLDYFITNEDLFYNGYPSRSISLQYNGTAARQVDLEFYINTNSDFKGRVCINGLDVGELRPFGFYLDGDSTWVSANYVQSSSVNSYTLGLWMEQGDQLSIEMEPEYMDSISQEVATDPIFGFNLDSDRDLLVSNGIAYTDAYPKFASNTTSETFANFFMRKGGSFGQLLNTLIARIEKIKQGDRAVFEPNETGLSERVVIEHTDAQILLAFLKFTRGLQLVVDMYGSGNIDLSYANYLNYLVDPVAIWDDYPNLMKLVASRRSQGAQAKQLFKQALQHYRDVESNLWTRQSALTESYLFEVSTSSEPMDRLDFNDRLSVFETSLSRTVILNQDDPLAPKDLGFSLKPLFSTSPVDLRAVMPQFDERGIYAGTSESLLTAGFTQGIDISKLEQSLADDELLYTPEWGELYDDFSGSELDTQKWDTWYMQGGLGPTVEAGELKLSISPGNPSVKVIPIEELQSAFIDGTDNSGVTFADPSIIGVEADLRLPADVPLESGVFIDSVSSSRSKVKTAGIELAYRPTGPKLDIEIGGIDKGSQPASLDQTYRVRLTHINGKMQIFIDGSLVLNSSVSGEFLGFIIGAFNDAGQSMTATVDNVRVLRARDTLKVQVSLAQGIIADSDADATVLIDGEPYAVSLVRGKGTLQVAMPIGSTYTVSASLGEALTSGDPRSVLMNKAATVSLVLDGDSDEDGLPDSLEARYKGKADNPDTDGDGIPDGAEVNTYRTRVDVADTDKDGLDDYEEINTTFTNPLKADSDGDRMSDYAELQAGTDPTDKSVYPAYLKVQVSLAQGITGDGDATVSIQGDFIGEESYAVSLVRGKGTLQVAMPIGSTYTVSASRGDLTSGDPRSVLLNRAATVSLVLDGDSDGDGLPDSLEARYKGDPNDEDTDDDGILDGAEVNTHRTRVDVADTDKDGLNDYDEINNYGTDALKADSDGDRMSDYAELQAGTDPSDKSVYPAYLKVQVSLAKGIIADSDADATVSIDGAPYAVSLVRGKGTLEVAMPIGSTYTVSASRGDLTSGDPRSVLLNRAATVSLVLDGDSDGDGLPDSLEARYKGDPNDEDTDDDGILDGAEVNTHRTRVDVADTDKDGLNDYDEINTTFTNPLKADSDGDRMSDYAELQAGTDPSDKSVYPAYLKVQVSLAKGITADSDADATVSIDGEPYAVSLVRGKGTLEVAMPIGSTYTVSASRGDLTSGDPRSVLLNRAATVSLVLDGDSDGDGLPDSLEARYKGDPNDEDTDDDGILDGAEVNTYGTRVDVADTDKDGFTDKQELDLNTNPLSSKDKPEAYIQRPVLVDLNLTYESANGYIVEKWDTAEMAYFLSSAVKDPQQGASIYLKYSLDGSNLKWIVRANGVDIDVSSLMRPIKVSKPAQLDGEVLSSIDPLSGTYSVTQMFSLAISAGRTKSLSLVVSGESSFSAVGPNVSGLELDLATSSDYKALGMLKDPSRSNGSILIEGTLTMGDELANVLGQIIGSVETK